MKYKARVQRYPLHMRAKRTAFVCCPTGLCGKFMVRLQPNAVASCVGVLLELVERIVTPDETGGNEAIRHEVA